MGGVLLFIAGMIVGGVMGIFCLCLVQINNIKEDEMLEERNENYASNS